MPTTVSGRELPAAILAIGSELVLEAKTVVGRVAALAGLEASVLERVYRERLRLTPGAQALLEGA